MVALKEDERCIDYWLPQYLVWKKALNASLNDNECIEFMIGSIIIKGEYLTLEKKLGKTSGYVILDYRPSAYVYHIINNHCYKNPTTNNVQKDLVKGMIIPTSFIKQYIYREH